jgi:putative ABC transport system substrate-binding protein
MSPPGRVGVIAAIALAIFSAAFSAEAQPPKVHRIGFLETGSPRPHIWEAFRQGLRDLGYQEGQNIAFELRYAHGKNERLPGLAAELVGLKVDVIVTAATAAALAAKQATTTIPIVMASGGDPVGTGLVASLARPGGNVTGLTTQSRDLAGKRLQLLREVVPGVSRFAILWHQPSELDRHTLRETEVAARALGVALQALGVRGPTEFDAAFSAMSRERAGALVVTTSPIFFAERKRLMELVAKHRLPTVFGFKMYVDAGGLMSYGASTPDLFRRAATYVDKILKGAKPADLPVEQPTRFELVINLRTAKAIGLTIPQSVLFRADTVIR